MRQEFTGFPVTISEMVIASYMPTYVLFDKKLWHHLMVKSASTDIYNGFPQNRNLHLSFKTTVKPCSELSLWSNITR